MLPPAPPQYGVTSGQRADTTVYRPVLVSRLTLRGTVHPDRTQTKQTGMVKQKQPPNAPLRMYVSVCTPDWLFLLPTVMPDDADRASYGLRG